MNKKITSSAWCCVSGGLLLFTSSAYADISGNVFRDFNGNGQQDSAEPLVAGIAVKAYDTSGNQCGTTQTSTSASAPNYTVAGCTGAVRVEFAIPATGCQISDTTDFSTSNALAYGSSIQFLADAASGKANFGLQYPGEYGGAPTDIPDIYSTVMRAGDPLVASPTVGDVTYTANQSSVLSADYLEDGRIFNLGDTMPPTLPVSERQMGFTTLANAGQTGTLWGNAYSKQAKRLFVSAFVRRHAGLGPLGAGGIYVLNPSTPNLSANLGFVSLDALGFSTHAASGAYNIKSNTVRELPAVPFNVPTHDVDAYDQVGKTALGDLELSDDGRYLFTVNLYDRKLYRLDLRNPANPVVPTAAQVTSYAIPNACTGAKEGEYRPFGLKVHRGKLYVGSVCSGENAALVGVGTSADMKLNVHEYNVSDLAAAPSLVYTQTLAYRDADTLKNGDITAKWSAWSNQFSNNGYNAPMLTDIDFDNKGNLLLGLTDRNSYQTGSANYSTNTTDTTGYSKFYANGDLLKLNKGADCKFTSATGNFYQNDFYDDNARWTNAYGCGETCHHEQTLGAIATHRFGDKDEVVTTAFNPVFYTSNGYIAFNNSNGKQERANEVWYDPNFDSKVTSNFGKAGGLGDIEVLSEPAPIEIGNRVWEDTDGDGIQDAGEPGIDNVVVKLKCGTDPVLMISTSNGGQYLFSSATTATTMGAGENCTLSVDGSQTPLKSYTLAAKNADGLTDNNPNTDIRDSDATDNAGTAEIAFTVGKVGENNHSLDFGYRNPPPKINLKLTKTASKASAKSGDTVVYTLTLTNESAVDATGVEVNDALPSGLTYVSNAASQGSYAGNVWSIGSVKAGKSVTLEITAKIK